MQVNSSIRSMGPIGEVGSGQRQHTGIRFTLALVIIIRRLQPSLAVGFFESPAREQIGGKGPAWRFISSAAHRQ